LPVISQAPNFDSFHPPKENGSRGTGTPMFTPTPAVALLVREWGPRALLQCQSKVE
jgi:hypothetical protein